MTTKHITIHRLKITSTNILKAMQDGHLSCFNPYQLSMDNFIIRDVDWHLFLLKSVN